MAGLFFRCVLLAVTVTLSAAAQAPESPTYPGRCETPVSQRVSAAGCYLIAEVPSEPLPNPVFWHLDTYPTMAAAEAARAPHGTAVQALGRFWVFTLADEAWRPTAGDHVASIGPLKLEPGTRYTARYMESILPAAVRAVTAHSHAGPEAFYIVSGAQCLETPDAATVSRAGDSAIMQAGPPMALNGVGTEPRAAVFLVLHDSTQPWVARGGTWSPPGRCPR